MLSTVFTIWAVVLLLLAVVFGLRGLRARKEALPKTLRARRPGLLVVLLLLLSGWMQSAEWLLSLTADLSSNQRNTFSRETTQLLRGLNRAGEPVVMTAFVPEHDPAWRGVVQQLRRYDEGSRRISVRFINPDLNPTLARQYELERLGGVYVEQGSERVRSEGTSEGQLTTALVQLVNGEHELCWTEGHGELRPGDPLLSSAVDQLRTARFTVRPVRLFEGAGGLEGCDAIIVAAPQTAPLPVERQVWETYLQGSGRALLLLDPDTTKSVDADVWLEAVRITAADEQVVDPAGSVQGDPRALVTDNLPSANPVVNGVPSLLFLGARAFSLPPDVPEEGLTGSTLAAAGRDEDPSANPAVAVALDRSRVRGSGPESRIERLRFVVVGDADWLNNATVGLLGNRTFWLRSINWLVQAETLISIPAKVGEETLLVVRPHQLRHIDVVMYSVPLLLLIGLGGTRLLLGAAREGRIAKLRRIGVTERAAASPEV